MTTTKKIVVDLVTPIKAIIIQENRQKDETKMIYTEPCEMKYI